MMLAQTLLFALTGLASRMLCMAAPGSPVKGPLSASRGGSLRGGVTTVTCKFVVADAGPYTHCEADRHLPDMDFRPVEGFFVPNPDLTESRVANPDLVECRLRLRTDTVAFPNRCHELPDTPGFASCEATIPTFLLNIAYCDVAHASEKCIRECDQYTASDTSVFSEVCAFSFINFHQLLPGAELEMGLCIKTSVAQVPPGRDLVEVANTSVKDDGVPLSAAPGAPVRQPLLESEWESLIGGTTYVTCTPVVEDGKIFCRPSHPLPNQRPDWTRLPSSDQVECRVSLLTKAVALNNFCQEVPGSPGFSTCGATIPASLVNIAWCEMTGVTDVVPGIVQVDRHERCDGECDQYTDSDTCVFSEVCAVCFIDFHLLFPGDELEKGLCKMTPVRQVPPGRDLVNVTCTPVEVGGEIRCRSNYRPLGHVGSQAVYLQSPFPVECRVELSAYDVALPNECQDVPGRSRFTFCTAALPKSLLRSAECEMISDDRISVDLSVDHKFVTPSSFNSNRRISCDQLCEKITRWNTCVVEEECRLCVQDFRNLSSGVDPERGVCEKH